MIHDISDHFMLYVNSGELLKADFLSYAEKLKAIPEDEISQFLYENDHFFVYLLMGHDGELDGEHALIGKDGANYPNGRAENYDEVVAHIASQLPST